MSESIRFPVEGMTCTSCVAHITKAVKKVPGVEWVKVDLGTDSAAVTFDPEQTSPPPIAWAIREAGYTPHVEFAEPYTPAQPRGLLARLRGR